MCYTNKVVLYCIFAVVASYYSRNSLRPAWLGSWFYRPVAIGLKNLNSEIKSSGPWLCHLMVVGILDTHCSYCVFWGGEAVNSSLCRSAIIISYKYPVSFMAQCFLSWRQRITALQVHSHGLFTKDSPLGNNRDCLSYQHVAISLVIYLV